MVPACSGQVAFCAWLVAAVTLLSGSACAQSITVDGRLSPAQTLTGPNYAIGAALGRQNGGNLFQSFGIFGLKQGESATFAGPANVSNVIGRVTGGTASSINGAIVSSIPRASVYLINPAGVVFGPNASVNVSGSFHASSADYLRMKDGARFQATNPDASTLTVAPPEAFGFLSANPQPVAVNGSTLQLRPGGTLGLVGGDVTISHGVLLAPSGTVHVASAAGPGELPVDPQAGPPPSVTRSGNVQVVSNSTIYPSGGSVFIRAGSLSVSASVLVTDNSIPGQNGVLSLYADHTVSIQDGATVVASATSPGHAPGISIGTAAGGMVTVDSATVATNAPSSAGGGPIAISTGVLTLQNGAVVVSNATNSGNGGSISATAGSVLLDGSGTRIQSQTNGAGSVDAAGGPVPAGAGGTISLTGGTLAIQNGASIEAATTGGGTAGSIGIAMTGNIVVTTGAQILANAGATASPAPTESAGDAGAITLSAGTLTLTHGGSITSDTVGPGNAGEIALNVGGALSIDGTGKGDFSNSVSSQAAVGAAGSAGGVRVSAGSIALRNGGSIDSSTAGTGRGGAVLVTTPGALLLDGGGAGFTDISASALGPQSGDAGAVTISAGSVTVQAGAQIASSTAGPGRGGDVGVTAGSALNLLGLGPQITAVATGAGAAGSITVASPRLSLSDGASISTAAQAANGGNITIGRGDLLYLQHSSITTSVGGAFGNGGNITVDPRLVVLDSSQIQADAVGGNGGNVLIRADQFVPSADSAVTATSQRGISGEIFLTGPPLDLNSALVVLASALRSTAALLREGCAARGANPRSSLVVAGRGGPRQGVEAMLPALYFIHRPIGIDTRQASLATAAPTRTSIGLSSRCD